MLKLRNKSEKDIDNQRITFTCIGGVINLVINS